jgi:hypothetical protein
VANVTKEIRMPQGYDVLTGILVAIVILVMLGGAFGRSQP